MELTPVPRVREDTHGVAKLAQVRHVPSMPRRVGDAVQSQDMVATAARRASLRRRPAIQDTPPPARIIRAAWGLIRDAASALRRRLRRAHSWRARSGARLTEQMLHHTGRRPSPVRDRFVGAQPACPRPGPDRSRPRQRRSARRVPAAADSQASRRGTGRPASEDGRAFVRRRRAQAVEPRRRVRRTTPNSSWSTACRTARAAPGRAGSRLLRIPHGLPRGASSDTTTRCAAPRTCTTQPMSRRRRLCTTIRRTSRAGSSPSSAAATSSSICATRLDPDTPAPAYADRLLSSGIAPSKQLLAVAAEEVQRTVSSSSCWTSSGWPTNWCCTRWRSARSGGPQGGRHRLRRARAAARASSPCRCSANWLARPHRRCTRPAPGRSPRPFARYAGARVAAGEEACSSTSTASWTPNATASTC